MPAVGVRFAQRQHAAHVRMIVPGAVQLLTLNSRSGKLVAGEDCLRPLAHEFSVLFFFLEVFEKGYRSWFPKKRPMSTHVFALIPLRFPQNTGGRVASTRSQILSGQRK